MPFVTRLPALTGADPYPDALLALDFVGARRGPQYYKALGVTTSDVSKIPGWTYTGGTAAGTGSYAAKADGSLQFFPSYTNLLLQSQTFGTTWAATNSVLTENQIAAPDGTTTADKLNDTVDGGNAEHFVSQSVTPISGNVYSYSVYAKAGSGGRSIALRGAPSSWATAQVAYFDVSSGSVLGVTGGGSATITSVGSGWYRCNFTTVATSSSTSNAFRVQLANGTTLDYVGSGTSFNYIWGAQLELGSTASTYIPTTTAAVTVGTPRITDAGYWAEEARTNSIRNSTATNGSSVGVIGSGGALPTNWGHAGGSTAGLTATVVATGTDAGLPYIDVRYSGTTSSVSLSMIFESTTAIAASAGQVWTSSQYTKLVGGSLANITNIYSQVDGIGGSAGSGPGTAVIPSSTLARMTATYTLGTGATNVRMSMPIAVNNGAAVDVTLRIYQPQLELGSFATSPIPTTSVAVTRAADVGYVSGIAIPTTGTMVATVNVPTTANDQFLAFASDGTLLNRIYVNAQGSTGNGQSGIFASAVGNTATVASVITGSAKTVAMAYTAGAQSTTANGANPVAGSIASVPSVTRFDVGGGGAATATRQAQGPIRRIVIYPRAFGNSELQAITTAGAY